MARTAYEEALAGGANTPVPSYLTAGDTLNIANQNGSFLESALDVAESIPKFIAVSLISGANQLYNIPADIGNLIFDADIERSNTQEVINSLDSDLGAFYEEHQGGADLAGFMLSSLVPGLGGVKILKAGQQSLRAGITAGKYGDGMGKALGLLAPMKKVHLDAALKEAVTSGSFAGIMQGNALRAVGAGIGQNALEALAFETAVAASMFNSPILENQDFGDFVSNVAWGAGVFGIAGGVIDGALINSSIKRAANKSAIEARPWTAIAEPAKASTSYERIALRFDDLANIPPVPEGLEESRRVFLEQAADTKRDRLFNFIRKDIAEITGGDQATANVLFHTFKGVNVQDAQSAFIGLQSATTMGTTASVAKRMEVLSRKMGTGKATLEEVDEFLDSSLAFSYAKTWGEDAGKVMTESPVVTNLVDTLKPNQSIHVTPTKVTAGGKKYVFNLHANTGAKLKIAKPVIWNPYKTDTLEANARYIWADKLPKFEPTARHPLSIDVNDIPLMEKLYLDTIDNPAALDHVTFTGLAKDEFVDSSKLLDYIGDKKVEVANRLVRQAEGTAKGKTQDEIAAIVNVKSEFLGGVLTNTSVGKYSSKDIFAMQDHAETYVNKLIAQGVDRKAIEQFQEKGIWNVPQHLKLTYDTTPFKEINGHVVENMTIIKEQQKLYQQATSRASANTLGSEWYDQLEDISSGRVYSGALPTGAGAGFATSASSNYGTLAATVENIGNVTSRAITAAKDKAKDALEPLLYKLSNSQKASIEWSTLNARVRAIPGEYGLNEAGDALEPLVLIKHRKALAESVEAGTPTPKAPVLPNPDMELHIPLQSQEVRDLVRAHIEINGERTVSLAGIRTAQGAKFNRHPDAFYPIPVDPREFPHFAMVTDESITSGNHHKTLFASSAEELEAMIRKLKQNPHLRVRTKREAEEYFASQGRWDYEKTLSSNYLDNEAHRKGVSAPFIVSTDPQKIVSDMLNWHLDRETGLIREAVSAKYEVQFNELRRLGEEATNIATSTFGGTSLVRFAEDAVKNPFADYIKTALAIRKTADYPWWVQTNQLADRAISNMFRKVGDAITKLKVGDDLTEINNILTQSGYKGAVYDAEMQVFANASAAKGTLTRAVQKANSLLATVVLRWDPLNAVNNAVSANVLLGAETKAVIRAINAGDKEAVGALSKLAKIKVPGTGEEILAPEKLIANAIQKFNRHGDDFSFYKKHGFITSISDQYKSSLDSITFTGKESIGAWEQRLDKLHNRLKEAGNIGEWATGNKLAEEFNRFVAADVMKQLTDVAVTRGLMTSKEQLAYINTFVNRTQGNYLAAQRPMMFQGAIGQAIGLFQTYQFNLMQQLLRHVGEGHAKDAMTLLALQGTIHGMNGLPAFNAVNTHIVGNASGNTEHKDAYTALYGTVGKEAGDWLMYGLASNALGLIDPELKVNLYTRGDINPRHVTVVPASPADIPVYQASVRFFSNILETASKLGAGGDVATAILQGIEHNGLSRPLAGLAQTLQGFNNPYQASYSTSNKGNVVAANDLLSLTNLARIVGGKPLDEAIALDATFRFKAYALKDSKKRTALGEAIKTTLIAGNSPTTEQIEEYAQKYAEAGGKQQQFGQWMAGLYKTANLSQANKLQQDLSSPFSKGMQVIMGGQELRDFSNTVPQAEEE